MPTDKQIELHLPAPPVSDDIPLVPARMVNEFVYCPRLAYLMWTQAEWSETGDTVEGRRVHTRVDRPNAPLPAPEALETEESKVVSRSLTLSSQTLGVIAKTVAAIEQKISDAQELLIGDDLSMAALQGGLGGRAAAAIDAGCDVVLHCNGVLKEMAAVVGTCGSPSPQAKARIAAARARISVPGPIGRLDPARLKALLMRAAA